MPTPSKTSRRLAGIATASTRDSRRSTVVGSGVGDRVLGDGAAVVGLGDGAVVCGVGVVVPARVVVAVGEGGLVVTRVEVVPIGPVLLVVACCPPVVGVGCTDRVDVAVIVAIVVGRGVGADVGANVIVRSKSASTTMLMQSVSPASAQ